MIVARPAARSGRQHRSVRVSAPGVVPFAVTNRTTERSHAGRVPVVRPFIAACHGWKFDWFIGPAGGSGLGLVVLVMARF